MTTEKRPVKEGDACPDCKQEKLIATLTCNDDDCGCTVSPKDGYLIGIHDGSDLCDLILNNVQFLTCYNCGEILAEAYSAGVTGDKVGVLHIDPGSSSYPIEPDEPAELYFECLKCAEKEKEFNQIQKDLLSSFLVGHWKEISKNEHKVAFERILDILNPAALQLVKRLVGE